MATTPEIKTKFTIDGMKKAVTGLRAFGKTVADTLGDARQKGGKVFDPLERGIKGVENQAKAASKAVLAIGGKGAFTGLRTSALGAGIAVGGLTTKMSALSAAALRAAKESAASLKSISIDAQRIGGSTSDVAVLGYAADITGTDRDELVTQIATISNEFLTLRENIQKSKKQYGEFINMTAKEAALAKRLGNQEGLQDIIGGFGAADLEARKASITDIEARIAQIDSSLNRTYASGDRRSGTYGDAARLTLTKERLALQQAADEFRNSQSPQAQALFELEKYGIDIDKASRGGVEGLLEISDAFQKIENPSQRARVAMRLFGEDAGVKLIPLLNGGRKAIDEYRRTLEESGAIATKEDIANAEEYSRAIQNLKTATSGVQLTIGRALTPDLTAASVELTAWLVRSREEIAKVAVAAFRDTRVFAEDTMSLFSGDTDNIQTGWLDVVVQKTLGLRAVWVDVRRQVALLWEGKDADYGWLNTLRDAFAQVKAFAMDAWAVVSGGNATNFEWLNKARDQVVAFGRRFQAAFEMLKGVVKELGDFFKPILDYFNTDIATLGLFVGLTRMIGLFPALALGAGLLWKSLAKVFSLAGAALGISGAATGAAGAAAAGAAGAAGTAAATAGGLRVALAGVGAAIGGLTSAALLLGTTLAGAFMLGQQAAKMFMTETMAAHEKVIDGQAAVSRAADELYMRNFLSRRDETSRDRRDAYWNNQGIAQGGWKGKTAAERNLENAQNSDTRIWGKTRFSGEDAAARYKEDKDYEMAEQARRAAQPYSKRVAVDLNVAGATTTLEGDEVSVMQLTRKLEQATRGY